MAKGGNVIFDFDGNTKPIENVDKQKQEEEEEWW